MQFQDSMQRAAVGQTSSYTLTQHPTQRQRAGSFETGKRSDMLVLHKQPPLQGGEQFHAKCDVPDHSENPKWRTALYTAQKHVERFWTFQNG